MKTFVISLKESTERRKKVEKALIRNSITFTFFDAVNVKADQTDIINKYNAKKTLKTKGYILTNAEIGCFLSHYKMWEKCVELNEPILILEDNLQICTDLANYIEFANMNIEALGILKFGSYFTKQSFKICNVDEKVEVVKYLKGGSGASSYMLSPSVAKRYIELSNEFYLAVDDFMDMECRTNVPLFTFYPSIICRSEVKSIIGNRKVKKKVTILEKIWIEIHRIKIQFQQIVFNLKFSRIKKQLKLKKI